MGKLVNVSGKETVKSIENAGWRIVGQCGLENCGQVGSHVVMAKAGRRANLSIPQHKELPVGTLRSLIRFANLTVDEFLSLG